MKPENEEGTVAAGTVDVPSTPAPSAPASTAASPLVYCPYQQSMRLQQALTPGKMRVAFLLGAGCGVAIRVPEGESTKPLIPDINGLTAQVIRILRESAEYKDKFSLLEKHLEDNGKSSPNIEEILSHVRTLHEVAGKSGINGLSKNDLGTLDTAICKEASGIMSVRLPSDDTPYHNLARWIASIPRTHPVEIFTPNYDLLMEQALEECRVPYFDGFVGSCRTFFDLTAIEQDRLPQRWSRLWKVHGSINWWRTPDGEFQRREKGDEGDRLMIHPSHLKYWESRRHRIHCPGWQ